MCNGDCMAKINIAVFDTGPFIHLEDVDQFYLVKLIKKINISGNVYEELRELKDKVNKTKNIELMDLSAKSKDFVQYLIDKYELDDGEATSIAICKQENIELFFTDDLEARNVAKSIGFQSHGTLAIITRAFREKLITKVDAIKAVKNLHEESSLFITADIIEWTIREIEKFEN